MDHNVDWLGDEISAEELNEIVENGRYGWPFVYFDGAEQQLMPHREPYFVSQELWREQTRAPLLGYAAHAAPMEMHYYTGSMFPPEYRNDAFVAMHGSWNRAPAVGYELVRVRFDGSGTPQGIEPFVRGFLIPSAAPKAPDTPGFVARPIGLAELPDGSLLVSDDGNNQILRLAHGAVRGKPAPQQLASRIFAEAPDTIELKSTAFQSPHCLAESALKTRPSRCVRRAKAPTRGRRSAISGRGLRPATHLIPITSRYSHSIACSTYRAVTTAKRCSTRWPVMSSREAMSWAGSP